MNNKNYLLYIVIAFSVLFSACIQDIQLSDKAEISYFYIPDQNGNSGYSTIKFDITQPSEPGKYGTITNTDSFPYNTLQDSLIPIFTSSMNNQAYIYGYDTVITVTSGVTDVDFTGIVTLSVIADDGASEYSYKVEVKESVVNPVGMNWAKKTDSIPVELYDDMKAYRFNNKTWVLTGKLDPITNTVVNLLYSSTDGSNWTAESISSNTFPMGIKHSICSYKDKLYSLGHLSIAADGSYVAKNEIWESSDGVIWTKTGALGGDDVIFRETVVFKSKLYAFGGSKVTKGYTPETDAYTGAERSVHVFDGNNWSQGSDIPSDMPTRKGALGVFHNKLFYIGGETETGVASTTWVSGDGQYWAKATEDKLLPTVNGTLFEYDDRLWLVGGEENGSTIHTIQESMTEGLEWYPIESLAIDGVVPYLGFLPARAGQSSFVDENNRVWVIGGYQINFSGSTPRKSNLYDVWTGKMNKFN